MIVLRNQYLEVHINPARGAEITALVPQHAQKNALAHYQWDSPIPAGAANSYQNSELDWLSGYRGGWQETVPNVGEESDLDGMPLPFHGEGSVIPWTVLEAEETRCVVQADLRPTLRITREVVLSGRESAVHVTSRILNTGQLTVPFIWGHHPAFACDERTLLHLPAGDFTVEESQQDGILERTGVWPEATTTERGRIDLRRLGPSGGSRLVYRHGHDGGWAVLRQGDGLAHVAMAWDQEAYPATWVWQNRLEQGFPWFGRMQSIAVEPQSSWPMDGLAGARARGQDRRVLPGKEMTSWITVSFPVELPVEVSGVSKEGTVLAG